MIIKKYEGKTEQEALESVREDLGLSAIILSIKKKKSKGLFSFLVKPTVLITAALDEKADKERKDKKDKKAEEKKGKEPEKNTVKKEEKQENKKEEKKEERRKLDITVSDDMDEFFNSAPASKKMPAANADAAPPPNLSGGQADILRDRQIFDQRQQISVLENKLSNAEELLARAVERLNVTEQMARTSSERQYENNLLQLFYDSLVGQGVTSEIAAALLEPINNVDEQEKIDIPLIIKIIYGTILNILGEPQEINQNIESAGRVIFFMGPTGVGKTTTIAKLSSVLTFSHNLRVGLITADTYRIAAVEQLKIYADILGLDIQVVYNTSDMERHLENLLPKHDVVLVDTAGRSHKNADNLSDLTDMIKIIPDCKKFLVLSATTKYEDLLQIVNCYANVADFGLIFTKLDETCDIGVLLNVCYVTGKKVSYVTFGQNVPNDIGTAQPDQIAKALLGLGW